MIVRRFTTKRGSQRFRTRDFERLSLKPPPTHRFRARLSRVMQISFDLESLQSGRDEWSRRLDDAWIGPVLRAELQAERRLALRIARAAEESRRAARQ